MIRRGYKVRIKNISNLSKQFSNEKFYYCDEQTRLYLNSKGLFEIGTCLNEQKNQIQFIFFNNGLLNNLLNKRGH